MRNKNELKIHAYINKSMNAMNVLMNRFIGFGGFGFKRTTTVVATTVVATTLMYKAYKAYRAYRARTRIKTQDQPPAFENKYFKEYDELVDDPNAPVPPLNNHVRETTPQGDVIMTYDADRAVFCYYCDKRTVQFKYLEPVARKYVIAHGCKRLYIDFREELTKAKGKAVKATTATAATAVTAATATAATATAATTATATAATATAAIASAVTTATAAKPTSIFAQFKKYSANKHPPPNNNKNNKGLNANANANAIEERACVLKEQVTRYLCCGRLDDFVAISEADEPSHANESHDFNIIKPIDYASYKKINDA